MAGIGFELRKIFRNKTEHSLMMGTIYASVTTIGPTILFLLFMLGVQMIFRYLHIPVKEQLFFSSASLYVFIMSFILSGSLNTIITRYTSDMIYEQKEERIPAAMYGAILLIGVTSAILELIVCIILYLRYDVAVEFLIGYNAFGIMIAISYTVMTFISAIKEYAKITKAYMFGLISAVGFFFLLYNVFEVSVLASIMSSMAGGFFLINVLLIYYIITYFGIYRLKWRECFSFLSYYKRYPLLALSGLVYSAGLYISNIIYWFFSDIADQVAIFHVVPDYDMATFFAMMINLSAMVIFTVKVETRFYEKYKKYTNALNYANYGTIEKARKIMNETISQQLFYIYEIQLIITILCICLGVLFFPMIGIGGLAFDFFLLLGIAVYCIFCMNFTVIFLYYYDDQKGSCITTGVFFVVTVVAAIIALRLGTAYYAVAPLIGSVIAWIVGFVRLKYYLKDINAILFSKRT